LCGSVTSIVISLFAPSSKNIYFLIIRYIILAMSRQNRVRKLINLDIKKEIISKREGGKSEGDLNTEYGMVKL